MDTQIDNSRAGLRLSSNSSVVLLLVLLFMSIVLFRANAKTSRLSRLGAHPPILPSRLPFGIR